MAITAIYDTGAATTKFARDGTSTVIGDPPEITVKADILTVTGTSTFTGASTFSGDVTVGDAVTDTLILKGRVSTSTVAGAALSIGATYTRGEANELRYTLTSWAGTGNTFNGLYLRPQSDTDNASGSLRGAEILAVANASAVSDLKGVFGQAYIKGDTAETIDTVYGVHAEVSFDASRVNSITLTEATPLLSKILSGKVADYTKFHGAIFRFGDMDGGARTFGDGVKFVDDTATAGTCLLTNGVNVNIGCTTGVLIGGATTTAVSVTGNATDAFKTATGTFTNGVNIGGTVTTGVTIGATTTGIAITGAATTGIAISGATTTGVAVSGNATDAFKSLTGTFTNGLNIGGTVTTGATFGACTTLLANTGAISGHVFDFSAESTAVEITAATSAIPANTGYLLIKVAATTYRIPVYGNS